MVPPSPAGPARRCHGPAPPPLPWRPRPARSRDAAARRAPPAAGRARDAAPARARLGLVALLIHRASARVPHGLTSVVRAVEDVGVRGPRQEPGDGAQARVGVRDAGARGAPGAAGAGGAGADPGGRRDPRAVRAAALRDPPGPLRRRGALPGPQGAQGAAQRDGEGAEEAQPAARGGVGGPPGAPRGCRRSSRRRLGAGRGAGAAVPDLPGRDARAAHAGALPALLLRGVHRAGAAGALRLPRLRPLLRAAGGQPAPRRPHAGHPRRRAAPARLRGLRHHHHPVRLPARRAGGGAPEPGGAVPGHHARGVPARLPRGEQGAGAVPQGLRPAPHLHRGHLADHRPCQRHHLERHPPQDQLHRRAPAVRVPRPHVPRPGAGGAAGQGHHRGLSGGAGTRPGQGDPPVHRDPPRIPPGTEYPPGASLGSGASPDSRTPRQGDPPIHGDPPGQEEPPPGQRDPPTQRDPPCRGIPPFNRSTPEQGEPPGPPGWQWGAQGRGLAPPRGLVPHSPRSTDRQTPVHSPDPQDRQGDPCPLPPQPRGGPTLGGVIYFLFPPQVCNFDPIKICNGLRGAEGAGGGWGAPSSPGAMGGWHQELQEAQGGGSFGWGVHGGQGWGLWHGDKRWDMEMECWGEGVGMDTGTQEHGHGTAVMAHWPGAVWVGVWDGTPG